MTIRNIQKYTFSHFISWVFFLIIILLISQPGYAQWTQWGGPIEISQRMPTFSLLPGLKMAPLNYRAVSLGMGLAPFP